ncbi:hypothetical protein K6119_04720 [Paracrocinitomix mangrovi]|uniref:hypothetical protein n=1 Tax=Paracrocinitomix mangrovi TaxID=2862509 RepID=UPI001C8D1703|nr:hypothetical protein [Paracrocinitomix mangrovi]UKN02819.1 hypothetical protein K6119_04720 [Paracrocinitomix mangrovi]
MHLQQPIKFIAVILFLLWSHLSFSQSDSVEYVYYKYRTEPTPYFTLGEFKRGVSDEKLKYSLDSLELKPRTQWTRQDSLEFARISLETGNMSLSEYYFENLHVDIRKEENFWFDHLMIHYLNEDYEGGLEEIKHESPMIIQYSKIYFFRKIFNAKIGQRDNSKWYKENSVLGWELDSTIKELPKDSEEFNSEIITPLRNLEYVLKRLIVFVHEDDPIIAATCREMGVIIEYYLNYSHAYIAYSLGRHYNIWDKQILENLNEVKSKLSENNYKIPNFRKYFPRIEEWKFDYNVLKEKVMSAANDTNVYVKPETMAPEEDPIINFPHQYVVLGGILLLIILLAIILKPVKK